MVAFSLAKGFVNVLKISMSLLDTYYILHASMFVICKYFLKRPQIFFFRTSNSFQHVGSQSMEE